MDDPTSCLFGLDSFRVLDVERDVDGLVQVVIETVAVQQQCPGCGGISERVKDRPLVRIKDLPVCGRAVVVWWRKRRLICTGGAVSAWVVHRGHGGSARAIAADHAAALWAG